MTWGGLPFPPGYGTFYWNLRPYPNHCQSDGQREATHERATGRHRRQQPGAPGVLRHAPHDRRGRPSKFKSGCRKNSSLSSAEINQLETMIIEKVPMAFNKSHSLCYTTISYWCAYYKVNFEKEFDSVFTSQNK